MMDEEMRYQNELMDIRRRNEELRVMLGQRRDAQLNQQLTNQFDQNADAGDFGRYQEEGGAPPQFIMTNDEAQQQIVPEEDL